MSAAAPATQLPRPGDIVGGKYVIDRLIGQGGMGAVFAAKHRKLGQSVAIKVMLADPSNPEAAHRFINEARAAANIQNEHVVRVDDVDEEMGYAFMVLELLEGEDLAQVLEREQRVAPHLVVNYLLQALKGVGQAHALGFVHRDLKPSNLFLAKRKDGSSIIKVLDFGISKASNAGALGQSPSSLTSTKAMLGSPLYMSPEQLRSSKSVDQRADIWAIGVILFELLTGTLPFMGENLGELFAAILETDPPGVRQRAPNVPADLEAVVTRCLQRRPENRFQTVAELVQALGAVNLQVSTMALNAPPPPNALAGTALLGQSPMQPGIPYGTPNNLAAMGTGSGPQGPGAIGNLTPQGAVRPQASTGSGMHAMHPQAPMHAPGIGAVTPQPSSGLPVAVTNSSWQTTGGTSTTPRSKTPIILGAVFGALAIIGVTAGAIAVSRRSTPPVGSSTVATSSVAPPPPTAEVPSGASSAAAQATGPSSASGTAAATASAPTAEATGSAPTTAANHPPPTPTPKSGGHHTTPPKVDPPKPDPAKVDPPKADPPKPPAPKPTASSKVQELR